jgi:CheY-like chemotaxis protein
MAAATALAHSFENELPGGKVSVLYAEDQTSSRVVTTALLKRLGYEVDAVEDGELALQKAMQRSYDIILLDIEMPVMDGVTAARRIRSECPNGALVPILAMSAYIADTTEDSQWRSLFDSALPKPAKGEELRLALTHALKARSEKKPEAAVQPLIHSIRSVLPRPMWARLAQQAGDDMSALALTAAACFDADDKPGLRQSLEALSSLAASFDAQSVLVAAEALRTDPAFSSGSSLCAAVDSWIEGATS